MDEFADDRTNAMTDPTSFSLLDRARSNDQQAWEQIVHLYGPLVDRWCRRSGLKDDDTADVFQETFRTVSSNLENFSPARSVGSFRSWLKTIVRTRIVDHFRAANRQARGQGGTEANIRLANVAEPPEIEDEESEAEHDHSLLVRRACELIRPEFNVQNWNAFEEVVLNNRSAAEVARELDVSPQTIRQANYRIRRRLRLMLRDLDD